MVVMHSLHTNRIFTTVSMSNIILFIIIFVNNSATIAYSEEDDDIYFKRIVVDLEKIYGSHGVPVEYWYTEPNSKNDSHFGSSPGCPMSIDGFPWVYYGEPPRCFLAGHIGPCLFGEKLVLERDSLYGVCACDCLVDYQKADNFSLVLPHGNETGRYLQCYRVYPEELSHGQLYDRKEKKCYRIFKRGPCPEGTVIAYWTSDAIKCLPFCNESDSDWMEQSENGLCRPVIRYGGGGGSVSTVVTNEKCPEKQRFSKILKKCVKQFKVNRHIG